MMLNVPRFIYYIPSVFRCRKLLGYFLIFFFLISFNCQCEIDTIENFNGKEKKCGRPDTFAFVIYLYIYYIPYATYMEEDNLDLTRLALKNDNKKNKQHLQ